jgi:hypothetical protein
MRIQTKRNLLRAATAAALVCTAAVVFLPATTIADNQLCAIAAIDHCALPAHAFGTDRIISPTSIG